jgi:hypothetical protein
MGRRCLLLVVPGFLACGGEGSPAIATTQATTTALHGRLAGLHETDEITYRAVVHAAAEVTMLPPGEHSVGLSEVPTREASLSPSGEITVELPSDATAWQLDVSASPRAGRSMGGKSLASFDLALIGAPVPTFVLPPHRSVAFVFRGAAIADERLGLTVLDEDGGSTFLTPELGESDVVLAYGGYVVVASTATAASTLVAFTVDDSHPAAPIPLELAAWQPFTSELRDAAGALEEFEFVWIGPVDSGFERPARLPLFATGGRIEVRGVLPGTYAAAFRHPWAPGGAPALRTVELREGAVLTRPAP